MRFQSRTTISWKIVKKNANQKVKFPSYLMRITMSARNGSMSVTKLRVY